jgi:PLP dependent protein
MTARGSAPSSPCVAEVSIRLADVRRRIEAAGRDPDDVTIVAVTKGFDASVCREALAAGLNMLGENRVQEGLAKMDEVDGATWHLIGTSRPTKCGMR